MCHSILVFMIVIKMSVPILQLPIRHFSFGKKFNNLKATKFSEVLIADLSSFILLYFSGMNLSQKEIEFI